MSERKRSTPSCADRNCTPIRDDGYCDDHRPCHKCGGSGYTRSIRAVGDTIKTSGATVCTRCHGLGRKQDSPAATEHECLTPLQCECGRTTHDPSGTCGHCDTDPDRRDDLQSHVDRTVHFSPVQWSIAQGMVEAERARMKPAIDTLLNIANDAVRDCRADHHLDDAAYIERQIAFARSVLQGEAPSPPSP